MTKQFTELDHRQVMQSVLADPNVLKAREILTGFKTIEYMSTAELREGLRRVSRIIREED